MGIHATSGVPFPTLNQGRRQNDPLIQASYLPKTMGDLAHDVGQRSHNAGADPKISSRRPFEPSRSHQKAEHKTKSDNRQCGDNETGENGGKHVSSNIYHRETERTEQARFQSSIQSRCPLSLYGEYFQFPLIECRWNCRIQPRTKTKLDLLFRYP